MKTTLELSNAAANRISEMAWQAGEIRRFRLHTLCYRTLRKEFPLSSQLICGLFAKVADAYKHDHLVKRVFRKHGSIAFHKRTYWLRDIQCTVSLWTTIGRQEMQFECGARQRAQLAYPKGEADLIYRNGQWFMNVPVEVPEDQKIDTVDVLGVDMGIVEIASDSDGRSYSGSALNKIRHRNRAIRRKLQKKGTKSAKRLLKKRRTREANFARNTNHVVSNSIVRAAKHTNRAIAIEELTGIRARIRARKRQRASLSSWAFRQLGSFIEYKATLAGVPLVKIDPRNTSRRCGKCGHTEKANRKSQSVFSCKVCGYTANADFNGAGNIRLKGLKLLGAGAPDAHTRSAVGNRADTSASAILVQ